MKGGAVLVHAKSEVGVEAFPQDIPHAIELDISSLLEIDDYAGNKQFEGDGTADHPPLYNRDVLAFLPFQVTSNRFVIRISDGAIAVGCLEPRSRGL